MTGIKAIARKLDEQDIVLVLKNLNLKILGQSYDEVLPTTDRGYKHYKANEDRIIFKNRLLLRIYYGQTGSIKHYEVLFPEQFVEEVLRILHGDFCRHPRITKTINTYREK